MQHGDKHNQMCLRWKKANHTTFLWNLQFVCLCFDFFYFFFFSKVIQIASFEGIAGEMMVSTERVLTAFTFSAFKRERERERERETERDWERKRERERERERERGREKAVCGEHYVWYKSSNLSCFDWRAGVVGCFFFFTDQQNQCAYRQNWCQNLFGIEPSSKAHCRQKFNDEATLPLNLRSRLTLNDLRTHSVKYLRLVTAASIGRWLVVESREIITIYGCHVFTLKW